MKSKLIFAMFFLFSLPLSLGFAEEPPEKVSPIGLAEYQRSCAVCHGLDAKGKGIMADTLKNSPPDLTILSKQNGGRFPHERVYQTIEGLDQSRTHGSREMPIWGKRYKDEALSNLEDEYLYLRGRMFELMIYLQSIQEN